MTDKSSSSMLESKKFEDMGLDPRILKAITKIGWTQPTLIQEKAIPLLLEGKDVLMRARTGSGKTGAFAIPIIQNIFLEKEVSKEPSVKALILAPSKELCHQLHMNFLQLTVKCSKEVRVIDISPKLEVSAQRPLLEDFPDVVVATPARALVHLGAKTLSLKALKVVVVDEADLMFSFGYADNLEQIIKRLPKVYQACLASATLSEDVTRLKGLLLRQAVVLRLKEPALAPLGQLAHSRAFAEEDDKAALLLAHLRLGLLKGRSVVFVNTVDKAYKLKLFLEQFGIKTCVLNSELPSAIRCHSLAQFNEGVYDTIIASDEATLDTQRPLTKREKSKDTESGVSRGIDFQSVSNVVNFDFPLDATSYIHRAGRTARGTNTGAALSFVSTSEVERMHQVEEYIKSGLGEQESIFKACELKLEEVEGLKYRAKDAWRATTRIAVREARLKEIKQEMANSQRLKGYFEDNPRDLKTLRHDKALHTVKGQAHLGNVPDYLVPESLKGVVGEEVAAGKAKRRFRPPLSRSALKHKAKKRNILLSLEVPDSKRKKRKV